MTSLPTYDADQLASLLAILPDVDAVELKISIPYEDHRRVVDALEIDPLDATLRQVAFLDTRDLRLSAAGLVVRARRTQHEHGDITIKLRPMLPADVPAELRDLDGFKVEVDASPTGFTCSCSLTSEVPDHKVKALMLGDASRLRHLLGDAQRSLLGDRLPAGVSVEDLVVLGPVTLLKAKFAPENSHRRLVAELWSVPGISRILELSTKSAPLDAFRAAAETKVFLAKRGVDLGAPQETKTRTALAALAATYEKE